MKNTCWLTALAFAGALIFATQEEKTSASVVDLTQQEAQAQSEYEAQYPLRAQYTGTQQVTFESYSTQWTEADLQQLEAELLQNKYGEEIKDLGRVVILPDYSAGERTMGEYHALYQQGNLVDNRVIYLFGGDTRTSIQEMAPTLSHEYGHHFTFYYLIEKEGVLPQVWKDSNYADARTLNEYDEVYSGTTGEYEWGMAEILAEDYVQLFGSDRAIDEYAPMNPEIPSVFETPDVQQYWKNYFPSYEIKDSIALALTNYERNPYIKDRLSLQFGAANLQNAPTTFIGREGTGTYESVQVDRWNGTNDLAKWYRYSSEDVRTQFLLDDGRQDEVQFFAVQHQDDGFNRGSETLRLTYEDLDASISTVEDVEQEQAELTKGVELSLTEKKQLLMEAAKAEGIPPEILKAIAYQETGMRQFENGKPYISEDGGIGIMQLTIADADLEREDIDKERLKWDTAYNIQIGAQWLKKKWADPDLPQINNGDPDIIEHWYFALMAYNGLSKRNDPTIEGNDPYQDKIYDIIRSRSLVPIAELPTDEIEIRYPIANAPDLMVFPEQDYKWEYVTNTTQLLEVGDTAYAWSGLGYVNLRDGVNGSTIDQLPQYYPLEIIAGPFETDNESNQYVMYRVRGYGKEGYVASLLQPTTAEFFPDINRNELAVSTTFLQHEGIISGYEDGFFRPNQVLNRGQAANILVQALELTPVRVSGTIFADLSTENYFIQSAETLFTAEVLGGSPIEGGRVNFMAGSSLTREQMAKILVNAFGLEDTGEKVFVRDLSEAGTDQRKKIQILAQHGITALIDGYFNPKDPVTRGQFTLFLQRALELERETELANR